MSDEIIKPKLLILLQNFYGYPSDAGRRLRYYTYDTRFINRKNATYSRIVPTLEPYFELHFGECTPIIGGNKDVKFPTDLEWVDQTIKAKDWFAVLAFSSQAHKACDDLNYEPFAKLPHPVSFKWRKHLIVDILNKLQEKIKFETVSHDNQNI